MIRDKQKSKSSINTKIGNGNGLSKFFSQNSNFDVKIVNKDVVLFKAFNNEKTYGIQFHPEVYHTKDGKLILENFLKKIAKIKASWTPNSFIDSAIENNRSSVTLVHKGNIMKYTEGAFRDWGYEIAKRDYGGVEIDEGPWQEIINPNTDKKIVIKDVICDAFLQQILLRPTDYDVIATMNLNGDYISDALAAMVGGIGIAPGANISDNYAIFEATHGTAPKYAGKNQVNPGSLILSAEMMLRHMSWSEAADLLIKSMDRTIAAKKVTYDFARMMDDADKVSSSGFADEMIKRM